MLSVGHNLKVWIFITLCCLLAWTIYWVPSSIFRFSSYDGTPWDVAIQTFGVMFAVMELSAAVGMLVRFIGVFSAIISLSHFWPYSIWNRNRRFSEAKNWVASALALESCYFALLLPSGLLMIGAGISYDVPLTGIILGVDYLLMVLFTAPFLAILAVKIYKLRSINANFTAWNWVSMVLVGYVASLWVNNIVKWIDVIMLEGFGILFKGFVSLGALNSLILMSLALIFTIIGAFSLVKQNIGSAFKWLGSALVFIGLHYIIYVIYSFVVGMQGFLMIAEIWTIPLLGLGVVMLRTKVSKMEQNF